MGAGADTTWPRVRTAGLDGLLVSFADRLSEPANRAALALRAAVDGAAWDGVEETATSAVSTYLRFDPVAADPAGLRAALDALLATRDWYAAPLPHGRRLWRIPTAFGGENGPELDEVAAAVGMDAQAAVEALAAARLRVQTIGFAPGFPYMGELPPEWDIPRRTTLTARVPVGALCVAIRQLVLFPSATPTGWRHVGQTAVRLFRPEAARPFLLKPGDEVCFDPVGPDRLEALRDAGADGGATSEAIP